MSQETRKATELVEWHAASAALPGQVTSGDLHVVEPFENGVLAAVIDGLGHGSEAASAAEIAAGILKENPGDEVVSLLRRCNEALRRSRGVVMAAACFDGRNDTMSWAGVGNVEGVLIGPDGVRESLIARAGVVGCSFPRLLTRVLSVRRGDVLIIATDGIRGGFRDGLRLGNSTEEIAKDILERYRKETDDRLVLAVRYLGWGV